MRSRLYCTLSPAHCCPTTPGNLITSLSGILDMLSEQHWLGLLHITPQSSFIRFLCDRFHQNKIESIFHQNYLEKVIIMWSKSNYDIRRHNYDIKVETIGIKSLNCPKIFWNMNSTGGQCLLSFIWCCYLNVFMTSRAEATMKHNKVMSLFF